MCEVDRLPPRQRAVFEFLRDELQRTGICPSIREIAKHFGIASPNGVSIHLRALQRKGFIARERRRGRAIRILHRALSELPLAGVIGAGPLLEAIETVATFDFDTITGDGTHVAILVTDDSLRHQHVVAGDYLIGPRKRRLVQPRWLVRRIIE